MVNGLLGRTITFRKTPGIPEVFLSLTQRVGQTVGHFGYATGKVLVQEAGRILLRAAGAS